MAAMPKLDVNESKATRSACFMFVPSPQYLLRDKRKSYQTAIKGPKQYDHTCFKPYRWFFRIVMESRKYIPKFVYLVRNQMGIESSSEEEEDGEGQEEQSLISWMIRGSLELFVQFKENKEENKH
ncbi:hypothetical protein C0J52_20156 [Blattella germanica]|nr:hypothetical protein C0J52_20156 [Blattella germanica]